jgi:hypothetical protein
LRAPALARGWPLRHTAIIHNIRLPIAPSEPYEPLGPLGRTSNPLQPSSFDGPVGGLWRGMAVDAQGRREGRNLMCDIPPSLILLASSLNLSNTPLASTSASIGWLIIVGMTLARRSNIRTR